MAPETIKVNTNFNEKTDIYSFGTILWELNEMKTPFEGIIKDLFLTILV